MSNPISQPDNKAEKINPHDVPAIAISHRAEYPILFQSAPSATKPRVQIYGTAALSPSTSMNNNHIQDRGNLHTNISVNKVNQVNAQAPPMMQYLPSAFNGSNSQFLITQDNNSYLHNQDRCLYKSTMPAPAPRSPMIYRPTLCPDSSMNTTVSNNMVAGDCNRSRAKLQQRMMGNRACLPTTLSLTSYLLFALLY